VSGGDSLDVLLASAAKKFADDKLRPTLTPKLPSRKSLIWKAATLDDALFLRHVDLSLRHHGTIRTQDRHSITKQLRTVLSTDHECTVLRMDIHRCFKSISPQLAMDHVVRLPALTVRELNLFEEYLTRAGRKRPDGIPWGISPSCTVADLVLSTFDRRCRALPGVLYYARFVDDIVLVSASTEPAPILQAICECLPPGLRLHKNKRQEIRWLERKHGHLVASATPVEFLGYSLTHTPVSKINSDHPTVVRTSLSHKKELRLKYRIDRAIAAFMANKQLYTLRDRIRLLTGNLSLDPLLKQPKYRSGIYFNYRLITDPNAFRSLDIYLRQALSAIRPYVKTTSDTMLFKQMCRCSFWAGHKHRITHRWSHQQLNRLQKAWK